MCMYKKFDVLVTTTRASHVIVTCITERGGDAEGHEGEDGSAGQEDTAVLHST